VEPTAAELARQLQAELPVSREHLRTMIERFSEMHDALDALGT
jgi:hypothetical protein